MISAADIRWLAGLAEGEASFGFHSRQGGRYRAPLIQLSMCDRDVVERVCAFFQRALVVIKPRRPQDKVQYRAQAYGAHAAGWMMTLYSLLGQRRRTRIQEVLQVWRTRGAR